MATVDLTKLRALCRRRAGQETAAPTTALVKNEEIDDWLNEALSGLRDLRIDLEGQEWSAKSETFTSIASTRNYTLPRDFESLLGVRGRVGSLEEYSLDPFDYAQQPDLLNVTSVTYPSHYRLKHPDARGIEILPTPIAGVVMGLDYIPSYTPLVAPADVTYEMPYGWWNWAVLLVAIAMRGKEKIDASDLVMLFQVEDKRIRRRAPRRDRGRAHRIKDTRKDLPYMRFSGLPRLWRSS